MEIREPVELTLSYQDSSWITLYPTILLIAYTVHKASFEKPLKSCSETRIRVHFVVRCPGNYHGGRPILIWRDSFSVGNSRTSRAYPWSSRLKSEFFLWEFANQLSLPMVKVEARVLLQAQNYLNQTWRHPANHVSASGLAHRVFVCKSQFASRVSQLQPLTSGWYFPISCTHIFIKRLSCEKK